MVILVRLQIQSIKGSAPGARIQTIAGVNTHYPAFLGPDHPELLLPLDQASQLGLYPPDPSWISLERSSVGGLVHGWFVQEAISVKLIESDREGEWIVAHAYIVPGFGRVLIADSAINPLGICIIDPARGFWCFRDELRDVLDSTKQPRSSARS